MKKYFLAGLAALLPVAITVYVVRFLFDFLTRPFVGIVTPILSKVPIGSFGGISSDQWIHLIAQILVLVTIFLFLLILGSLARRFFFDAMIQMGERVLHKIPLFNKIYKATSDIVKTLFSPSSSSFKQVVLLEFPHPDCYCLGLITSSAPQTFSNRLQDDMVTVFIPTTPNPMSGFMTMSPRSKLILLDMESEDAIKYVVSCGVIHPKKVVQ